MLVLKVNFIIFSPELLLFLPTCGIIIPVV